MENDKVTSMREEIKDIDGRISNLTKSFQISSKMKGEHTPADTIALVNDHLMKKARHQIIRKDLQVLHILYLLLFSIIRNNIVWSMIFMLATFSFIPALGCRRSEE